jgi:hypothetical protein
MINSRNAQPASVISDDTALLRGADLTTAQLLLSEAQRTSSDSVRAFEFVERARDHLYRAWSVCSGPAEQAVVEHQLALVYLTLRLPEDARYWLRRAAISADRALDELIRGAAADTKYAKFRYLDGRHGEAPPGIRVRQLSRGLKRSLFGSLVGLVASLLAWATQTTRRVSGRDAKAAAQALGSFIAFRNATHSVAASMGAIEIHALAVIRKEMQLFSDPAYLVRLIPPTEFTDIFDNSLDEDPMRVLLSDPRALFLAIFREARQAKSTGATPPEHGEEQGG